MQENKKARVIGLPENILQDVDDTIRKRFRTRRRQFVQVLSTLKCELPFVEHLYVEDFVSRYADGRAYNWVFAGRRWEFTFSRRMANGTEVLTGKIEILR